MNRSESGEPLRWGVDTVAFRLSSGLVDAMPEGEAFAATTMAFEAWRGLPRVPDLMLVRGEPASAGHHDGGPTNGVYLVRDWKSEPDQLAITVVTYSKSTGRVLDADILVNANATIDLLDEVQINEALHYDLGAILTHEAGHSLGLDESMEHPEATMWPRVSPGETHQRTLSDDDEEGVITNYAGTIPDAPVGCGQASVLGRPARNGSTLLLSMVGLLLALGAVRAVMRRGVERRTLAFGLGTLMLATPGLSASDDGNAQQREVAAHAHEHDTAALRAGSAALVAETDESAQARIARAFGPQASLRSLLRGRVQSLGSRWQDGFIVTEHSVRDESGQLHALQLPGGSVGDVAQHWNHVAELPADDAEIVVDTRAGATRWAYVQNGTVFGGSLGAGPAIRIAQ